MRTNPERWLCLFLPLLLAFCLRLPLNDAVNVCLVWDDAVTDTTPFYYAEAFTVDQLLRYLNHTPIHISPANLYSQWQTALIQCRHVILPENEVGSNFSDYIGPAISSLIEQWTREGGHFIQNSQNYQQSEAVGPLFGIPWSNPYQEYIAGAWLNRTASGTAAASSPNSPFFNAPAELGFLDGTSYYTDRLSVPASDCFYEYLVGDCYVSHRPYFAGFVTSLGYDFYEYVHLRVLRSEVFN